MRKGYLDGPFGQIHYYEQGSGPELVMLHQSPVSGRMFEKALPLLAAAGIRAIAIDTPGFGMSDVPPSPPTIADYASALHDVLAGLGLADAHFLGHHTGAGIAANFAAHHPEKVRSLIMHGPPLLSEETLAEFADVELGPAAKKADGSHLLEAWNRRLAFTPGWTDLEAMHRRFLEQQWAGDTSWYGHYAAFSHDFRPDLMAMAVPAMIMTNTGEDIYEQSVKAHALRPDLEFREMQGGTHDIVDEQPAEWSRIVAEFVNRQS